MATPRLSTLTMTREALLTGLEYDSGITGYLKGHDIVRFRSGLRRYVSLAHPDYVDHVLHAGQASYHKSVEYETMRAVLGLSLFTDEDASWQKHRKMLTPMFAKRRLNGLVELMLEPIEQLAQEIGEEDRREIEMVEAMVDVTLNVVGNALFSQQFEAISSGMYGLVTHGLRTAERALRLLNVAAPPIWALRALFQLLAADIPVPLPPLLRSARQIGRTLDDGVWQVVQGRREHPTDAPDLLNLLLGATDENGEKLPLQRVRNEALTFMLAGHETTANAMSWMWYLLALNPGARERMMEEVDAVLGDRRPTAEDLPNLPWTTACVQESMRYFSPAWMIPRIAIKDDNIAGHRIRRGTTVLIPVHLIHHDARWWPDPEEFDPSRFLTGDSDRPRSAYLPFGGGRRICIGSSFALMETTLIAAVLCRRFVFDLVPGHPVDPEATLTLRPRHGIKMVARRRTPANLRAAA
jgi:cytochrome P450